jgi:hypothetical protein
MSPPMHAVARNGIGAMGAMRMLRGLRFSAAEGRSLPRTFSSPSMILPLMD